MNGKDGKPFKTRDGGVMRLEYLLDEINEEMLKKITENQKEKENLDISEEEAKQTAKTVALAAVKYGDLSKQARTTVLILSVLLLLKGIQDRIFYIRLCVLNPF